MTHKARLFSKGASAVVKSFELEVSRLNAIPPECNMQRASGSSSHIHSSCVVENGFRDWVELTWIGTGSALEIRLATLSASYY